MPRDPTILLLDDDPDDLALASLAFARTGCRHVLVPMQHGEELLRYLYDGASHELPAMVFLDLKLPREDGKDILREIRGNPRTTRVPVIVLTSSVMEQDVIDAYCLGANSYLQKDTDFETFTAAASMATAYWLGANVPPPGLGSHSPQLDVMRAPALVEAQQRVARKGRPRSREILVIDGNPKDRDATMEALASAQVQNPKHVLGSFEDVVQYLRPLGGPPPLLSIPNPPLSIVEVDLPDGDGRDVLQALRYRFDHHAVVVMFTRNRNPALVSECYRVKVSSVVYKPDDPEDYREVVRMMARYWINLNVPPPDPSWSKRAIAHPG